MSEIPVDERRFLLPSDVLFTPVEALSERMRRALGCEPGEIAISRPGFRTPSRLADASTVALLQEFRVPSPIVAAILRFSAQRGLEPMRALDEAFPVLQRLSAARILVPEGSPHAQGMPVSWAPGRVIAGLEILEVIQRTHDTEVYRALADDGRVVALKVEQADAPALAATAIVREQRILQAVAERHPDVVPRIVAAGRHDDRQLLATTWIDGIPVNVRTSEIRAARAPGWRARLHAIVCAVVEAYARLHECGVLHGDVHPGNVLLDDDGEVTLIDLGLARMPGGVEPLDHPLRSGLGWYLDPDAAACLARGQQASPAEVASEQYAVGALCYELLTGERYLDFALDAERLHAQILADEPLPFTRRGFEAWPRTEAVLRRALAKRAEHRFASLAELSAALREATPPPQIHADAGLGAEARRFVARFVPEGLGERPPTRSVFTAAPIAAVDRGAAGLAWFYLRVARVRQRPDLLALADLWCRRADVEADADDAFHTPPSAVEGFAIDPCSVLHRRSGIHYVHAHVCLARGDLTGLQHQLERFLERSRGRLGVLDLTLGEAGVLLTAVDLLQAVTWCAVEPEPLRIRVRQLFDRLTEAFEPSAGLRFEPAQPLSFAHGWLGIAYALLRAADVLEAPVPAAVSPRLESLARAMLAAEARVPLVEWMPSWCNGTAGAIPAFLLAHERLGDPCFLAAAQTAARVTADHPDHHAHLCCGLAGRVLALLHMYQHTGSAQWLDHARILGRRAIEAEIPQEGQRCPHALLWGPLGVALALEELHAPEQAAMPLFGDQRWPRAKPR